MPKKRSAPSAIIKPPKRTRFKLGRNSGQVALDRLVSNPELGGDPPRVLLIVAHPDDEAIGAGVLLSGLPDVTIVHVTDGAPRDNRVAKRRGFPNRDAYAEARRTEVLDALRVVGVDESRVRCLGMVDGETTLRMVELCHRVIDLLIELDPEIVLTHPYEGGHTDHDTTAFAVHLACGILRREGVPAPVILELTSYHNRNGKRVRSQFLTRKNVPVRSLELTPEDQLLKIRMFEQFVSQRECLMAFPVTAEKFRVAPRYSFTAPPHEGELDYERYCAAICGEEWRSHAGAALEMLRSRHRVTPATP
jgi:LmbE family N-acetylglucosaminyl deacetylase